MQGGVWKVDGVGRERTRERQGEKRTPGRKAALEGGGAGVGRAHRPRPLRHGGAILQFCSCMRVVRRMPAWVMGVRTTGMQEVSSACCCCWVRLVALAAV